MKEIFEVIESRVRSPLFGYFVFAFISVNWNPLFYLFVEKTRVLNRIQYFQDHTDWLTLLIFPLVTAMVLSIAYPWVNYGFLHLRKFPTDLRNKLQASSEHELLKEKQKFAEVRVQFEKDNLKAEETSLKTEEVKLEKAILQAEETRLRAEEVEFSGSSDVQQKSKKEFESLMSISGLLRKRAENSTSSSHRAILLSRAQELEDKAFELLEVVDVDSYNIPL